MISKSHTANFETLMRAARQGDLAALECRRRSDGQTVTLLVAVGFSHESEEYTFTPFAELVNGNPFALYDPPDPDGGFYQEGDDD